MTVSDRSMEASGFADMAAATAATT